MGVLDKFERGLERAVKAPFAKVFKAEVQPVEIASAMRGAMDDGAAVLGPGRVMVPNLFTIELAPSDYERLSVYDTALTDELIAAAEDHADAQRYTPSGRVAVRLVQGDELETGIFQVRTASRGDRARQQAPQRAPAQRRPAQPPSGPRPDGRPRQGPAEVDRPLMRPERPQPSPQQSAAPAPHDQPRPERQVPRQAPAGLGGAAAIAAAAARQGQPGPGGGAGYRAPERPPADRPDEGTHSARPSDTRAFQTAGDETRTDTPRTHGAWLDIDGRRHPLGAAVTTIGRDESADIVLDDPGVSRRHAEIRLSHDGPHLEAYVRDLGSTNGTYLNGDQVGNEQLHDGDRLTVGRSTLVVHTGGAR